MTTRIEHDLLGEREIPNDAYWGIHTLRAAENFKISKQKISDIPEFVRGMVMVKKATARANAELGVLSAEVAAAIDAACDEVLVKGRCLDQFPSDVFQGGAGEFQRSRGQSCFGTLRQSQRQLRHHRPYGSCKRQPVYQRRLPDRLPFGRLQQHGGHDGANEPPETGLRSQSRRI